MNDFDLSDSMAGTTAERPVVKALIAQTQEAMRDGSGYRERMERAHDVRRCIWPGQSEDGRKHAEALGRDAFPWEGASDTRVRLADEFIEEDVRLMKAAVFNGNLQATGRKTENRFRSPGVTGLMRWMLFTAMEPGLRQQLELAAQWRQQYLASVLHVRWEQRVERVERRLVLSDFVQEAMAGDEEQARFVEAVADPLMDEVTATALVEVTPMMTMREGRRVIRELREKGEATYRTLSPKGGKVRWTAYKPMEDLFFPPNCTDLQDAPFVTVREWLRPTELKERVASEGWDEEWTEEALKQEGMGAQDEVGRAVSGRQLVEERKGYVEVWHVYYKVAEGGGTAVYYTVICPGVPERWAVHGLHDYEHGEYPFVLCVRERIERNILAGRGIAEQAEPWQAELKVQRDYRSDRASITVLPPIKEPMNRAGTKLLLGPGRRIPVRNPNDFEFMQVPQYDATSVQVEKATREDAERYFGRVSPDVPGQRTQLYQENLVSDWLSEVKVAVRQSWQLMQQYMTDEEVAMVVDAEGLALGRTREEIQGEYGWSFEFNPADLDGDALKEKLGLVATVLQMDTEGVIDRAGLIGLVMLSIDPRIAREVVRAKDAVTQAEIEDEQLQFTKIAAGVEPAMKEGGQNFALRLQTLENIVRVNPALQQRYAGDEVFRKLVDARVQHFRFQLQQQENALIGRLGAAPVLTGDAGVEGGEV